MSRAQLAKAMRVNPNSVEAWETTGRLSFPRIQKLAVKTRSPLGDLFLGEPIDDALPLPDFRAKDDLPPKPSQDLLETVFLMRSRQAWMRDELVSQGLEPLQFVGSCTLDDTPRNLAVQMRSILDLDEDWACGLPSWDRAKSHLRDCMEDAGILVVINGMVGNNQGKRKVGFRAVQRPESRVGIQPASHGQRPAPARFTRPAQLCVCPGATTAVGNWIRGNFKGSACPTAWHR